MYVSIKNKQKQEFPAHLDFKLYRIILDQVTSRCPDSNLAVAHFIAPFQSNTYPQKVLQMLQNANLITNLIDQ